MPTSPSSKRPAREPYSRPDAGFTFIELMVVLAILAVLYIVAVPPVFSQLEATRVNAAARALTAALKEARAHAIATARDVRFTVSEAGEWHFGDRGGNAGRGIMFRIDVPPVGKEENRVHAIRFFPDGASTGGRIWAVSRQGQWRIDVDWLTGRISRQPE